MKTGKQSQIKKENIFPAISSRSSFEYFKWIRLNTNITSNFPSFK